MTYFLTGAYGFVFFVLHLFTFLFYTCDFAGIFVGTRRESSGP